MDKSALFNDGTGPLVIDVAKPLNISHWVYVDNLGLICLSECELKKHLSGVVSHFNDIGLTMHETESGLANMVTLGCRLDCIKHKTKLTVDRRKKLPAPFEPSSDVNLYLVLFWSLSLDT